MAKKMNSNGGNANNFPEISFWNKKASQIEFVNPKDFHRERLLYQLELKSNELSESFGTSDREEIIRRQKVVKMLMENSDLRKVFFFRDLKSNIPDNGQVFINHFHPEKKQSSFWKRMTQIMVRIREEKRINDLPDNIQQFLSFLEEKRPEQIEMERKFSAMVSEEILKSTYFHGTVTLSSLIGYKDDEFTCKEEAVYGHRCYSYFLNKDYKPKILSLFEGITEGTVFENAFGIVDFFNSIYDRKKYRHMFIGSLPEVMKQTIENFVNFDIKRLIQSNNDRFPIEGRINLVFYVSFDEGGLGLQLIEVQVVDNKGNTFSNTGASKIPSSFKGYSWTEKRMIEKCNQKIEEMTKRIGYLSSNVISIISSIEEEFPQLISSRYFLQSGKIDVKYRWMTLNGVLKENKEVRELYDKINDFREYVASQINVLRYIAFMADTIVYKAQQWKLPISFPEILNEDQHLVAFDSIYPIRIIDRVIDDKTIKASDVTPIGHLEPLNGNMVTLTGYNISGKTTTLESIIDSIFMAQSGLPVFGNGFQLNPKRKIGVVFLERGDGSTAELMGMKTTNVLRAINDSLAKNDTLVLLDEVGSGIEQGVGSEVYQKFLKKFSELGCSIVIATQIPDLAIYARDELGALCFQFSENRKIAPGIGMSNADHLIDKFGAKDLLMA